MLRYQLRNTILTPAMAVAVLGQCAFMLVGLYPKANADMVYNLQQSMTLGYGWLFILVWQWHLARAWFLRSSAAYGVVT